MTDEYDLRRFVRAQNPIYQDAIGTLRRGLMCSPHMDFLFPRLGPIQAKPDRGIYWIKSLDEANAYLLHPILGGRYRECVGTLQRLFGSSACSVFGDVDAQKLHASLTLFSEANGDEFLLETMFDVWFDGLLHEDTMNEINRMSGRSDLHLVPARAF